MKVEPGKVMIKKLSVESQHVSMNLGMAPVDAEVWHHVFACIVQNTKEPVMPEKEATNEQ